jgi:hypothetical protein
VSGRALGAGAAPGTRGRAETSVGIMQSVEPVLENAIKTLQKVVDVRGMGKK